MKLQIVLFGLAMMVLGLVSCGDTVDEPAVDPVTISAQDFTASIEENPAVGDTIGQISVDVDPAGTEVTIQLANVDPAGAIEFTGNGYITVADAGLFDFAARTSVTGEFIASVGEVESTGAIDITITEEVTTTDPTLTARDFAESFQENAASGDVIGQLDVSVTPAGTSVALELSDVSPSGAIELLDDGSVVVADAALFDFETITSVTGMYTATAGNLTSTAMINITITDDASDNPPVFWTGPTFTFEKADGADPTDIANQDRLTDRVIITRGDQGQIYNIAVEATSDKANSPVGTQWAFGSIADDVSTLDFQRFRDLGKPKTFENRPMVMFMMEDNIYVDVTFLTWSENKNGGFSYERSTPN